ncbi:MocR-like pyridoxine biosynthesis transcription factor PdxR [Mycolicibacterium pyrenivorans]|uniref:MocR-like pyridoxine biosynthesis transcription factor PdxR n=1 Tax=Mycolicibacterium pyrenivorans TaxID=187102 RepID=UPI0021F284C9|nr:PLP-dependent aminotransferase family protein [Mycolicibacterium pyrenivorans]MCV7149863.1 PLP-dependent aminotransferase family protein [Mycolicibacterium pyrenivorans]
MVSWANSGGLDLHLDLHGTLTPGARGAKDALIAALREAARSGRLTPGTMLPPSRALATDLGLARNTVADAYAELVAEGWLASRQGAGTWVVNTARRSAAPRPRGARVAPVHNLMPGSPDVAEFPRSQWVSCTRRALANAPTEALRMGDPRGRPELRSALADYLARARGVRTSPDSIVICAGVRQAVQLLVRALGGPIAVEAYGLFLFRDAIAALGVPTVPIGVDDNGAVVSDLDRLDVPAVLLTPAHHNPLGMPLHPERRTAVVEWAQRTGGLVLDDDYDGEFRYDRQPVGALQALRPEKVAYLGSTSKTLSQVLRLGWMVLPEPLVDAVVDAAGGQQFYVDAIGQLTLADFIAGGYYDRHIRRMRARYRRRRDALVSALEPFDVGIGGLAAGVNVLLTLPDGAEPEVMRRAAQAGIALQGLSIMRHPLATPELPDPDGLIVGFAAPAEHAFVPAVSALCEVLGASGL